jgi:hypothetical protein
VGRPVTNLKNLIKRVIPSQTKSWNGFPCLEWTGTLDKDGYAQVSHKDRRYRVARLVASLYLDFDINSPKLVCHHCDNRKCIEHRHFFIGTARQNTIDAYKKGKLIHLLSARNSNRDKEFCKRGHPFSGDNLTIRQGTRFCKACQKFHNDKRNQKG